MPRPHRIQPVGVPQHVRQRGVNRQAVFHDDADRERYLQALAESAHWYGLAVHAYCLMTNHIHLLVTPAEEEAVSRTMRRTGSLYVSFVNRRYGRTGSLWEGRYRACLVDSDNYLLACQRYIDLNPVRASMVATPREYPWSSYQRLGLGKPDALLTPHSAYLQLGAGVAQRCQAYRDLCSEALDAATLRDIRDAVQRNHVLGGEAFARQIEGMLDRKLGTGRRGRPAKKPTAGRS